MIIDLHNHIGEPFGTPFRQTAEELVEKMDRAGVNRAVVFPFPFGNFDNDYVARAVYKYPDRLIGFVMISPYRKGDIREEVRRYVQDHGFRGVKLDPAAHGYKISELNVVEPILQAADEFNVPVMVYTGDEVYAGALQLLIAARAYPNVNFIMAHAGSLMSTNEALLVGKSCPNVYLEHASSVTSFVGDSIREIGPDRTVLGTATPWMDFEVEIYKMEVSANSDEERAMVLGGNAARLLQL